MKELPGRIVLKTPAKINLLLHVNGKRSDGYHDIITVMQMVDLWDDIIVEESQKLDIVCRDPEISSGQENLIYKAALKLKDCSGTKRGAMITLNKVIPVAAGLGGGSSDAAATLFGLNILWGLDYTVSRLAAIGKELGSDVPFFLNGPMAIGYGRGDELISVAMDTDYWFLLINPGIPVSTAWAYGQFSSCHAELGSVSRDTFKEILKQLQDDNTKRNIWIGPFQKTKFELTKGGGHIKISLPNGLRIEENGIWLLPFNDLEEVVIKRYPIIEQIKEKMVACGAMFSLISGSGSTVFGIFRDKCSAERAYTMLQESGWRLWIVRALQSSPYSY